jgi:uncharacterized protein (TIGR02246 family)
LQGPVPPHTFAARCVIPPNKETLMLHSTRVGLAALLTVSAACQRTPKTETGAVGVESTAAPAGFSAEDEAAIRAVDAEWARAATAGDGKALAALYAPDATVLPPGEAMKKGEAAAKYWSDFGDAFAGPTELNTTSVEGQRDLAVAMGTYKMALTEKKPGAKPLPVEEGKYVEVLKKQADGSWKLFYDIWNLNAPARTP